MPVVSALEREVARLRQELALEDLDDAQHASELAAARATIRRLESELEAARAAGWPTA